MALPESVRLKVEWSKNHLDRLEMEIAEWRALQPYRLGRHRDEVPETEFVGTIRLEPPIPASFALLSGDAVHNLRSALDHLACALVEARDPSTSETGPAQVEFPIFRDEGEFDRRVFNPARPRRINKIDLAAQAAIRRVQPFTNPGAALFDPLWVLHRLDIIDKHRQLSILGGRYSLPGNLRPAKMRDDALIFEGRIYVPFGDGDQIRIVGVDKEFVPDIKGWLQIRWDDGPKAMADLDKLIHIHEYVSNRVLPQFEEFFG